MKKNRWNWRYFLLHFLILLAVTAVLSTAILTYVTSQRKNTAQSRLDGEVENIQRILSEGPRAASILSAWLEVSGDDFLNDVRQSKDGSAHIDAFERFASALFDKHFFYSLQLDPDGVIRYIYPKDKNERLLGTDLLAEDSSEADILKEAGDPDDEENDLAVYTGPEFVSYIGLSLNARQPVFYEDGSLWGYVSAVIALPKALQLHCLDTLAKSGYDYSVFYQDKNGRNQRVTGSLDMDSDALKSEFTVQDTVWTLMVRPEFGWLRTNEKLVIALVALILAFIIGMLRTLTSSVQSEKLQELKNDADNDQMTGLLNHETAAAMIQQMVKQPVGGILFMIDIDYFKQVNDQAGHIAGDQVLIAVAEALRHTFRKGDVIGRYGGDEFVAYMPGNMSVPDFSVKASQFQKKVRAITVPGLDRQVTCSMGIARKYEDTFDAADLMSCADKALYESKNKGRDRFSIYEDTYRKVYVDPQADERKQRDFTYKD